MLFPLLDGESERSPNRKIETLKAGWGVQIGVLALIQASSKCLKRHQILISYSLHTPFTRFDRH